MLLAVAIMAMVLWLAQRWLFATPLHGTARMTALTALICAGLVSYGAAALLCGAADWQTLASVLGRRLPAGWRRRLG
jgi:hypothetical protein